MPAPSVVVVDIAVVAVVVFAARRGWRHGATWTLVRAGGLLLGLIAGLLVAGLVPADVTPAWHVLLGAACALGGLLVGGAVGRTVGSVLAAGVRRGRLAMPDRVLGVVVRGGIALVLVWVVTALVLGSTSTAWADTVRGARLATPDTDVPLAGEVYTGATDAIREVAPADLAALVPASGALPAAALVRRFDARTTHTVGLVSVDACRRSGIGTGFVAAPALVVTNAHVVRGTDRARFTTADATYRGTVVRVDRRSDLAFVRVPGIRVQPLPIAGVDAPNGSRAVVVGYPDGHRTAVGAVVRQRLPVAHPGLDDGIALHESYLLRAPIRHGNSGSPLLDESGRVIGVVNALLGRTGRSGLAIAGSELRRDLPEASADTSAAAPQPCP